MKLSTLLKDSIATKTVITDSENGYKRYVVDYISKDLEVKKYGDIEYHYCKVTLDKELTKRNIKYFDVYNNELHVEL